MFLSRHGFSTNKQPAHEEQQDRAGHRGHSSTQRRTARAIAASRSSTCSLLVGAASTCALAMARNCVAPDLRALENGVRHRVGGLWVVALRDARTQIVCQTDVACLPCLRHQPTPFGWLTRVAEGRFIGRDIAYLLVGRPLAHAGFARDSFGGTGSDSTEMTRKAQVPMLGGGGNVGGNVGAEVGDGRAATRYWRPTPSIMSSWPCENRCPRPRSRRCRSRLRSMVSCARQLSVERLLASKVGWRVLAAVGTDDQLADSRKCQGLAMQVDTELRSIIASIKNRVDRRIAQAVLATEEEFFDKTVGRRKEYLREHDGIFEDVYKKNRPRVIGEMAVKLERAIKGRAGPQLSSEAKPHDAHEAPTTSPERDTTHPARTQAVTLERAPLLIASRKRSGRRRRVFSGLVAAALIVDIVVGAVVLTRHHDVEQTWNGMTAAQLEQRYDGKLPQGQDGQESHCADPPESRPIDGASTPPVMGPDGTEVGKVRLRKSTSSDCPTVVWARVVWYGDEQRTYTIPPGWTLHVVMNRPDTQSRVDETEPKNGSTIHYAYSRMLTSARGCVYAVAYFTKGDVPPPTEVVPTSCVPASEL